jgi:hypothetical protein
MKQSNCTDRHNHKIITFKQNEETTTASERYSIAPLGEQSKVIVKAEPITKSSHLKKIKKQQDQKDIA